MQKSLVSSKTRIREIAILSMFIAIIFVMGFVPNLGFITIGPISATIIHIPVLIGGVLLGRRNAIILGFAFGVMSFIRAFTSVGFDYVFIFPWVSILPRLILGLLIIPVYLLFKKIFHRRFIALVVSFVVLSLLHSVMVLPLMITTFPIILGNASFGDAVGAGVVEFMAGINSFGAAWTLIIGILLSSSLVEAALAGVIGGVVADRLMAFLSSDSSENDPIEQEGI